MYSCHHKDEDEDENEETLYSLLEVSDDASMEEIK